MEYKGKANELKKGQVETFVEQIEKYPIIGVVNVEGLPTPQLQTMREKLRDKVTIIVGKGSLIKIALKKTSEKKSGLEDLKNEMKGMPALLFTSQNPFSLFSELKKSKSSAPAKAGQEAPKDIVIPAGPTPFAPGPIIGELGALGIKSGVEAGKVAVKEDTVVAKEGEKISASLAGILSRLGIKPMEVGLDLRAVYDNGVIYSKDILDVDEEEIRQNAETFAVEAFNLAMNAGIIVKDTVEPMMGKAVSDARAIALEFNIITDENVSDILAKAEMQAKSLDNSIEY